MRFVFMRLRLYAPVLSVEQPSAWALSLAAISALLLYLFRLWTKDEKAWKAVFFVVVLCPPPPPMPFVTKEIRCF